MPKEQESIIHQIVGYRDDREAEAYEIPPEKLDLAKKIAGVSIEDPDAVGSYPLTDGQAVNMLNLIDPSNELVYGMSYFLEPYIR